MGEDPEYAAFANIDFGYAIHARAPPVGRNIVDGASGIKYTAFGFGFCGGVYIVDGKVIFGFRF